MNAKTTKPNLSWVNIDPSSFGDKSKELYAKVREAFEITKAAKAAFSDHMVAGLKGLDLTDETVTEGLSDEVQGIAVAIQEGKTIVCGFTRGFGMAVTDVATVKKTNGHKLAI